MIDWAYRKLILPGFESGFKRRKTFAHWHDLEQSQWWDRSELESLQVRRLRDLLTHCHQHSPWYRHLWDERGLKVHAVTSLDDLRDFPITPRETMRDQADQIRSSDTGLSFVSKSTGGSSGSPLQFIIEREADDRRIAATFRGYGWANAGPGTKQSYLWGVRLGNVPRWKQWKTRLYDRGLYRRDVMDSFQLSQSNAEDYVTKINRFRPAVLVAYTNPLFALARSIEERGLRVHCPESIIVGAEKLHDFQRSQIERAFGAPVFETYGSREFTLIGAECEQHCGLHLSSENLIVEVVDDGGHPTPRGEEGQVVVTDLFNLAMPFIRYAIGDRAVAGFDQCACGRGLPLLKKVVGRQLDILRLPDGRQVPGEFFPHLMKDIVSVRQFQVVQSRPARIELNLVVDSDIGRDWDDVACDSLRHQIICGIGDSSQIEINFVPQIELTKAGKMRVVVGYSDESGRVAG